MLYKIFALNLEINVRPNFQGIIGIPLILLIAGSVALQWGSSNWWDIFIFASASVILYGIAIIGMSEATVKEKGEEEKGCLEPRILFGCHLSLVFLIIGTWLPPAHSLATLFPDNGITIGTLFLIIYFFVSIFAGMVILFLLLRPNNT